MKKPSYNNEMDIVIERIEDGLRLLKPRAWLLDRDWELMKVRAAYHGHVISTAQDEQDRLELGRVPVDGYPQLLEAGFMDERRAA